MDFENISYVLTVNSSSSKLLDYTLNYSSQANIYPNTLPEYNHYLLLEENMKSR